MSTLTLIFPIATIIFIGLVFADYLPLLKRNTPRLNLPKESSFTALDRILMLALTAVYALTAFINLGVNTAPQSFCKFEERGSYALIELSQPTDIGNVVYYTGLCTGDYYLQFSADGENWTDQ